MSRSRYMLAALALPADNVPPTSVASTSPAEGHPRAATNMVGTVVISSSSMIRGLVSATKAATRAKWPGPGRTEPAERAPALLTTCERLAGHEGSRGEQVGLPEPVERHRRSVVASFRCLHSDERSAACGRCSPSPAFCRRSAARGRRRAGRRHRQRRGRAPDGVRARL